MSKEKQAQVSEPMVHVAMRDWTRLVIIKELAMKHLREHADAHGECGLCPSIDRLERLSGLDQ
jgi:hypothetical protein